MDQHWGTSEHVVVIVSGWSYAHDDVPLFVLATLNAVEQEQRIASPANQLLLCCHGAVIITSPFNAPLHVGHEPPSRTRFACRHEAAHYLSNSDNPLVVHFVHVML
jgi:hypothetical protein